MATTERKNQNLVLLIISSDLSLVNFIRFNSRRTVVMDKVDTIKFLAKRCYHGKNFINPYTGQLMYQPCGECPACLTRKASILLHAGKFTKVSI